MPKYIVTLTETLTHRLTVEAATEAQAMKAAETFLLEADHDDRWLFSASGVVAVRAEPADPDAQPDLLAEGGA